MLTELLVPLPGIIRHPPGAEHEAEPWLPLHASPFGLVIQCSPPSNAAAFCTGIILTTITVTTVAVTRAKVTAAIAIPNVDVFVVWFILYLLTSLRYSSNSDIYIRIKIIIAIHLF
jgi:hypothetical protein